MEKTNTGIKTIDRYRVFDNLLEQVCVISHDFRVLYRNKELIDTIPLPKDLDNGFSIIETFPGIEKTVQFTGFKKALSLNKPTSFIGNIRLPHTKKIYIETRLTPVPEGILVFTVDITERMALRKALKKQNKVLNKKVKTSIKELSESVKREQRLNELKSVFVSMASHEFRTPLATMLTSVSMVEHYDGKDEVEKRKKYLNFIKAAITDLKGIVNDFLSFDKLETGKLGYHPTEVKVTDYFREIRDELQLLCTEKQQILYRHIGSGSEFALDRHIIKNVAYNLLSNAIKYSPEGGDITFTSELTENWLALTVTDQGIGIAKKDHKKLFEKFFRGSNAQTMEGTGLGLHIVKRYIELAGGNIMFYSQAGKGSSFIAELPRLNTIINGTNT